MAGENTASEGQLYVTDRKKWRQWLKEHHAAATTIWLVFYKKETGQPVIPYDDAVEEALCFGWIDSIVKKIDENRYVRKFTPRQPSSQWSQLNKTRVKKMIRSGRMTEVGLAKIEAAKEKGLWQQADRPQISLQLPQEFKAALDKNSKARHNFEKLAPSYKKYYIGWVITAKRPETRKRRIKESIKLLEKGEKLGLK